MILPTDGAGAADARAVPDTAFLTDVLRRSLTVSGHAELTVTRRAWNCYASSSASEIVYCRLGDASELQLLCKYDRQPDSNGAHRGGTRREVAVYREILEPLGVGPRFFGSYAAPGSGETWLFIEYLGDCSDLELGPPEMMPLAARWIADFHRRCETLTGESKLEFLQRYSADYFVSWPRRSAAFAGPLHAKYPWFDKACANAAEVLATLCEPPHTIIHGEYYPKNILCAADGVCPVDWESAAIGAGEIDLASLVMRWNTSIVAEAEREYGRARWPHSEPTRTTQRVGAAKLYWLFRWLGENPGWTQDPAWAWLFDELLMLSRRMDLCG